MYTIDISSNFNTDNEFRILIIPDNDKTGCFGTSIKLNAGMAMAIAQAIEEVVCGRKDKVHMIKIGI